MNSIKKRRNAILLALLAAIFYAINIPVSKLLLNRVDPIFMSAFLYLGAGIGIGMLSLCAGKRTDQVGGRLTRAELPYTIGMIILDIAAPILLMFGLRTASAANVSLLNNFEIVATTLIALFVFKEVVSKKLWLAIALITMASMLLSFDDISGLHFSIGSLFVLGACICWGFENNCTRMMSSKNTYQIVTLKGIFSGLGSLIIALISNEHLPKLGSILFTLLLGFISYGLSIFLYVRAQNELGAAKTSAYYAVSPFIGTLLSCLFFKESIGSIFFIALAIMICGTLLVVSDTMAAAPACNAESSK